MAKSIVSPFKGMVTENERFRQGMYGSKFRKMNSDRNMPTLVYRIFLLTVLYWKLNRNYFTKIQNNLKKTNANTKYAS